MRLVQEFLTKVTSFCVLTIIHLCSRADHVKENGLTYPSPGISNGIKLSPQETRPSSPAALPSAGEKVRAAVLELRDVTAGRTERQLAKLGNTGSFLWSVWPGKEHDTVGVAIESWLEEENTVLTNDELSLELLVCP